MKGKNIGLALSAQEALKKIAADENSTRRVAQAAAQALQSATLPEAVEVKSDDHFPVRPQKEAEQRKTEEIRPLAGDGQQVIQNVVKKEQHPAQVVAARVVAQPIPRAQKPQSPGLSSLRTLRPFMAGVIFLFLCFTAGWFIRPYLMPFILKETPSPTATIEIVIPPPIITATPSPTSTITDMPSVVEPTPTSTPTQTATPSPTVTNTRDNPEKFIIDYFNMVVFDDDFARGWTFLTPEFQVNVAHGWDEYQRFWGTVKEWKLSNIQTDYNDFFRARITITYRLYYMNNKSDLVSGNKYCLLWNDEMNSWQFDIKSNCP